MFPGRIPVCEQRCPGCGVLLYDAGLDYEDQAPVDSAGRLYCSPACAVEAVFPTLYPSLHGVLMAQEV